MIRLCQTNGEKLSKAQDQAQALLVNNESSSS